MKLNRKLYKQLRRLSLLIKQIKFWWLSRKYKPDPKITMIDGIISLHLGNKFYLVIDCYYDMWEIVGYEYGMGSPSLYVRSQIISIATGKDVEDTWAPSNPKEFKKRIETYALLA